MTDEDKFQAMLANFHNASTKIQVLDVDEKAVAKLNGYVNYHPQSYFGIVLRKTGGIIVDNWLRIYGSGEINFTSRNQELSEYGSMIVAEDISGGLFAMAADSSLSYFAPDCLAWEEMAITYLDFLQWITEKERVNQFYETVRFHNWEMIIKDIKTNQGIGYYPFLWAKSEHKERHVEILPIKEIQKLQFEFYKSL